MNSDKPHLLVVDDESLNRDLLRRLLSGSYHVSLAEDANAALEILASDEGATVMLVLSDHLMPGRTGVELAREVRKLRDDLPFVLLTGYDADEVADAKSDGTIAEIMNKPWRSSELRALIARFVH
tara:strand:+ start:85324 stop:85698 length:375 start_codon:yes stop_codon:yes gene_type:complete